MDDIIDAIDEITIFYYLNWSYTFHQFSIFQIGYMDGIFSIFQIGNMNGIFSIFQIGNMDGIIDALCGYS
jgi:hypothetical protein